MGLKIEDFEVFHLGLPMKKQILLKGDMEE